MNGKGQGPVWVVIGLLAIAIIGGGLYLFGQPTSEAGVSQTTQQIAAATQAGEVANIKVFVRDISENDINTKKAVPVYCQDSDGNFIIDGTSSSTSTEISGQSTRGKTVTCWAFNSTYQTMSPVVIVIDEDVEHVVIDTFDVPTNGHLQFYTDTLATGKDTANVTGVGADSTGTLSKSRYTNNNTDTIMILAGIYLDTRVGTNISEIKMNGGGALSLRGSSFMPSGQSSAVISSNLNTKVSTRKELWDFVWEFDSGVDLPGNDGASPVFLEENDYVETGTIAFTGDSDGCQTSAATNAGDVVDAYAFTKGYYRATMSSEVLYGHETDASSSAVITVDNIGDGTTCTP